MPNYVETRKIEKIFETEIVQATEALSSATIGSVRKRLIPIVLRMDSKLAESPAMIACREGCSFCCHYHVSVTAAEAISIAEHLVSRPAAERDPIVLRLENTAQRAASISREDYVKTNIPCAFLDGGRCSIYEARPAACRGFHSLDVSVCERAYDDPSSTEPGDFDPDREAVNIAFKHVLIGAQAQAGLDATNYEMHAAVVEALANRASFKRWKSGKVAFPSVRDRLSLEEIMS